MQARRYTEKARRYTDAGATLYRCRTTVQEVEKARRYTDGQTPSVVSGARRYTDANSLFFNKKRCLSN
ncbi:hypothetical protein [Hydrogenophilus thiooxidans]|uniref:hypothetical protein n=1 Tax=Hydrogenophilus thiooxidans TaxID=2820326 RepID=UPI001C24DD2F|nr:hypothetical protein [Hydrogenophilus thiooxidans]